MHRLDKKRTRMWALALDQGVSAGISFQVFRLANRTTGRAHKLKFAGAGLAGPSASKNLSSSLSYKTFQTTRPMIFDEFNGKFAMYTAAGVSAGIGYESNILTIFQGSNASSPKLAHISSRGFKLGKIGGSVQLGVEGVLVLDYGDGTLGGDLELILEGEEEFSKGERHVHIQVGAHEPPLMTLPGDVLFGFDRSSLSPTAHSALSEATPHILRLASNRRVMIIGHTDSKGDAAYNQNLSQKRAEAVRQWLISHGVEGAFQFGVKGKGETSPVAPNETADGSDNPEGRAQNRRVEFHFL